MALLMSTRVQPRSRALAHPSDGHPALACIVFKSFGIVLVAFLSQRHWLADQFFHDGAEWLSFGNGVGIILFRSVSGRVLNFRASSSSLSAGILV